MHRVRSFTRLSGRALVLILGLAAPGLPALQVSAQSGQAPAPESTDGVTAPLSPPLEAGKKLYTTYCSSCHGLAGRGNGVASEQLSAPLRPFTQALKDAKDEEVLELMARGRGEMPGWSHVLKQEELQQILGYIQDLAKKQNKAKKRP